MDQETGVIKKTGFGRPKTPGSDYIEFKAALSENYLVVLLYKVKTTVIGDECCDLLSVLDELDPHALTDSRVRLLSLDSDLKIG